MESAVRTICEPIFGRPLREISFGTVLLRLFAALQRFDGHIQPQLILLQKTLLNVEGLGRELYPDLDIWKTASPVLRAWRRERVHPRTILRELRLGLPDVLEIMKALPTLAKGAIERAQDSTRQQPVEPAAAPLRAPSAAADNSRRDLLIASAALVPGGVLWLGLQISPHWPGALLASAGVLVMAAAMFRD
jgi:ubiquinone biosynthesis protein